MFPLIIFIRHLYGGVADWRTVLAKNSWCEEECKPIIIHFCMNVIPYINLFFHCRFELFNLVNNVPKATGT